MNIRSLFILSLVVLATTKSFSGNCQDWLSDTCDLKGSVRKVNYKRSELKKDGSESFWFMRTYDYNKQGYLINLKFTSSRGWKNSYPRIYDSTGTKCLSQFITQEDEDTTTHFQFTYDDLGRLNKRYVYSYGDDENYLISETTYYHDKKGQQIKDSTIVSSNSEVHYRFRKFDSYGRLIKDVELTPDNKAIKTLEYDQTGLLIREMFLDTNWSGRSFYEKDKDGNFIRKKHEENSETPRTDESYVQEYSYNEKNEPIVIKKSTPEGQLISLREFTYNPQGNKITMKLKYRPPKDNFLDEKRSNKSFSYSYEYDKNGNWTSKLTYLSNQLVTSETRQIGYY